MAYKLLPEEKKSSPSLGESALRIPTQMAAKAATSIVGFPGDVASLVNRGAGKISQAITGDEPIPYEETLFSKILPTSHQHQENLERGIPYLKPKTKFERFAGDVAGDTASLVLPGSRFLKALKTTPVLKSASISLGANAGKEFVTDITGSEKAGSWAKLGIMFLGGAATKQTATKEISKKYKTAESLLPQGSRLNAVPLENSLNSLKSRVLNGRQIADVAPSEKFVVDEADKILRQISNGTADVSTLQSSLRSLNENLQKAVYDAPNKSVRVRTKKLATQINKDVNNSLREYGKHNPEWWKEYSEANNAFGVVQKSNFITNFIEKNIRGNMVSHGLLHLLGIGATAATGVAPYLGVKLAYQIANSKTLRNHYGKVISAAASEDAPVMNRELDKLDREISKENEKSKNKFRLVD